MSVALTNSYWPADTSADLLEVTYGDLLRQAAAEHPNQCALVDGGAPLPSRRRWTYAELLADSERVAHALLNRFEPGERVSIYASNCVEWVLFHHGATLAGLPVVPLNPGYKAKEAEVMLGNAKVAGVFYDERYRDVDIVAVLAELHPRLKHLRELVPLAEIESFSDTGSGVSAPLPTVTPDDPLHIQFTSGTTGVPKGALLPHRGIINSAHFVAERIGFPDGGVWVNAMPMYHSGGAATSRTACLSKHGTFVLAPGFDAGQMLELIESERGNTGLVVPTMILSMLEHESFRSRDLSSMVTLLSGATDVPASLVHRTKSEMRCRVTIMFGQSEVSGVLTTTHPEDSVEDQAQTVGQPLPRAEVKIAGPDGTILPLDTSGEICVRGYQTMLGYLDMPDATRATLDGDGWLRTGDLGAMDNRGFIRITGRLKDVIIRGGLNLYPREIEEVILEHPEVVQVSVVGIPDEKYGEIVAAVVIPRDPAAPPPPEVLTTYCKQRVARYKAPAQWFMVDRFPLTASGKVQKFVLTEWITAETIRPV
jgi:acyl-CoA synthetase (AMP-forming)/AMP-acid ligase II